MSSTRQLLYRFYNSSKCVNSKAARAALIWFFSVGSVYRLAYNPDNFAVLVDDSPGLKGPGLYAASALIQCFYPLAGLLADNKYGRFKVITKSILLLLDCVVIGLIALIIFLYFWGFADAIGWFFLAGLVVIISVCVFTFIPATIALVGFEANIVQFGMDQLLESPSDHQSLFIHWYVWVLYLTEFVSRVPWKLLDRSWDCSQFCFQFYSFQNYLMATLGPFVFILMLLAVLLLVSVFIASCKRKWFLIDTAKVNPYKLVYKVSRFAMQHKTPIQRSAFTYCEDELPTGLNLSKCKYGGPFSTEEVENVKAFYGILKILSAVGPIFFLSYTANTTGSGLLFEYCTNSSVVPIVNALLNDNMLSYLFVIFLLPLYLTVFLPFLRYYQPTMLKRIAIGIILLILSMVCRLCLNILTIESCLYGFPLRTIQLFLYAVFNMFMLIALFEFICAQSPNSMKGFLIGMFFAIRGLFMFVGSITSIVYFQFNYFIYFYYDKYYDIVNVFVGVVTLLVFASVARKYKNRKVNDVCNVYRYAEEYYSRTGINESLIPIRN